MTADERKRLGRRLAEAREYLNLSQEEISQMTSIPRSSISQIETGARKVDALELKALASAYKRPVTHFTGDSEETNGELPPVVARLAKKAATLSERDREELLRFANYLAANAAEEEQK